jgi:hypothetical protein
LLRVTTARRVADILWPAFIERNGMIFLPFTDPGAWSPPPDRALTEHERLQGHSHIQDLFRWDVPMRHDPELDIDVPDPGTPEHAAAWELARCIGEMWMAKLMRDFPSYRFRVYMSRLDDPIVHSHRVRDDEPVWIRDEEANDDLVILDSARAAMPSGQANNR